MNERVLPGIKKLIEAEQMARENARPEPIFSSSRQLEPRLIMPSAAEIVDLKKTSGIKYLGDVKLK